MVMENIKIIYRALREIKEECFKGNCDWVEVIRRANIAIENLDHVAGYIMETQGIAKNIPRLKLVKCDRCGHVWWYSGAKKGLWLTCPKCKKKSGKILIADTRRVMGDDE